MAQVRETIDLLTKVLRENGASKIKAEIFRLAKFDKDEAVAPLWKLVFELLYFLEHGVIDEVAVKACSELSTEEQVVFVKQEIQQRGFYSAVFSRLPNDMSGGSRELLLALAWLVCTEKVIDKFMENCASPIDEDLLDFPKVILGSGSLSQSLSANLSPVQKIQQLQLLNGKLRLSLKRLYSLQRERTMVQHKIHESTEGVSLASDRSHLSVMEVQLLRHPDYLKKMLKLLEKDNTRLQNLLSWRDQEKVFWKWMESVLDLKMKECGAGDAGDASHVNTAMVHYNIPPDLVGRMNAARRQLEASILKYEPIIEQLEEMWETKREEVSEFQLDTLLSAIDEEIALHRSKLIPPDASRNRRSQPLYREPRFVLEKNHTCKRSSNIAHKLAESNMRARNDEGDVINDVTEIQTETEAINSHLARLEDEVKRKEQHYRNKLDQLSAQIPDAICIQPTSLR